MIRVSDLFEVKYGVNLELNALVQAADGINFVSRTAKNNGVSAKVKIINGLEPISAGTISVAGGGSVMESFLQPEPYYSGRDLYYLTALIPLTDQQKLFYCTCLRANKYRFNYGRQANRTLKDILIPSPNEIPSWVEELDLRSLETMVMSLNQKIRKWSDLIK
ncbi:restriction endonuclease subunit S [Paenibacillus polymyxa]|uniref:restriction endonuclease subunit S n=1 Tax=Paenibacillus polymyxa TaxID=1406 RepID=UPI00287FA2AA|nr:restriction endonuclease subunit S [Paenibacillus polymyxa]